MAKTFIGILASHDSYEKNVQLAEVLRGAIASPQKEILDQFGLILTGGTYNRLFDDARVDTRGKVDHTKYKLGTSEKRFLHKRCSIIRLPNTSEGGVAILASLITRRLVAVVWPFFTPITTHLLFPENLALMRLADQYRVKKLMNSGSVNEWFEGEAEHDSFLNRRDIDSFSFQFPGSTVTAAAKPVARSRGLFSFSPTPADKIDLIRAKNDHLLDSVLKASVVALISHDAMKDRMIDFVVDYEQELAKFGKIIATGTTGNLIGEVAPILKDKVHRYHSGPKGGDVEIATQILFGACHVVVFFVDPLHPHPHTEDIRVVFGACMIENQVRMLSNEVQARDWFNRIIRQTG